MAAYLGDDVWQDYRPAHAEVFAPPPFPFNVLVILPAFESSYDKFGLTIEKARPVIDIAVQDVSQMGLLPYGWINLTYWDSRYWEDETLAERHATVGVVQAYCEQRLDAILGFADSYGLATVTKITAGLNKGVPVITTAGMPSLLHSKKVYPFLSRMHGSYRQMADSVYQFIAKRPPGEQESSISLNYLTLLFMYHDKKRAVNKLAPKDEKSEQDSTSSHCYFSLFAIKDYFTEKNALFKHEWALTTPSFPFDEELNVTRNDYAEWLKRVSMRSNGWFFGYSDDLLLICEFFCEWTLAKGGTIALY